MPTWSHPRFGTPWIAILVSAVIYALLAIGSFTQLISLYIWLRIGASVLTLLSAWQLRRTIPDLPRPFRIPGGRKGLMYVVGAPLLMSGVALLGSDRFTIRWGSVALLIARSSTFLSGIVGGMPEILPTYGDGSAPLYCGGRQGAITWNVFPFQTFLFRFDTPPARSEATLQ